MKRAIWIGFATLTIVAAGVGISKANEPEVTLPIQCNATMCILPKDVLGRLVAAHNAHVAEIAQLEAKVKNGCKDLPQLKKERDA